MNLDHLEELYRHRDAAIEAASTGQPIDFTDEHLLELINETVHAAPELLVAARQRDELRVLVGQLLHVARYACKRGELTISRANELEAEAERLGVR